VGRTALTPEALLSRCQALERRAGRPPRSHRRPRPLDLDLLYHGENRRDEPALTLPHPGLPRRRFVLEPLAELRPEWRHPVSRRSVREMLADLNTPQALRRLPLEADWWNQG
jgi:2-amino-4-hydroxy-6-hydroxymethyldihydropteridine diphosphokinase